MSICNSCTYNFSIIPNKPLCSEGIIREPVDAIQDCRYYSKKVPIKIPSELKNIIYEPFNYWNLVPRYVRGILSHKHLVLSDRGLCIFHSPDWVILDKHYERRVCPKLLKHLRRYIMSFSNNKRVKDLYVYLLHTPSARELYVISSDKPLRRNAHVSLDWEYSNNVYSDKPKEVKHVKTEGIPIYLPYIVNKVENTLTVSLEL